ncbi:hypothetical protein ADL12_20980 [Streptomyces regalis]|uniref:Uncharacterized protein n=1 Tax=Streptomyces regalis TaxID=68262 RepID=A0A0X3UN83_9ACTN|nr:hypothetical protein ADL12_20980 [Streptomyces regalis]
MLTDSRTRQVSGWVAWAMVESVLVHGPRPHAFSVARESSRAHTIAVGAEAVAVAVPCHRRSLTGVS